MKSIIIAAVALSATTFSLAQSTDAIPVTTEATVTAKDDRTPVKIADLPDPVRRALMNTEYDGWSATTAYWVLDKDKKYYEIWMTRADEKQVVYYNNDGSKLEPIRVED